MWLIKRKTRKNELAAELGEAASGQHHWRMERSNLKRKANKQINCSFFSHFELALRGKVSDELLIARGFPRSAECKMMGCSCCQDLFAYFNWHFFFRNIDRNWFWQIGKKDFASFETFPLKRKKENFCNAITGKFVKSWENIKIDFRQKVYKKSFDCSC